MAVTVRFDVVFFLAGLRFGVGCFLARGFRLDVVVFDAVVFETAGFMVFAVGLLLDFFACFRVAFWRPAVRFVALAVDFAARLMMLLAAAFRVGGVGGGGGVLAAVGISVVAASSSRSMPKTAARSVSAMVLAVEARSESVAVVLSESVVVRPVVEVRAVAACSIKSRWSTWRRVKRSSGFSSRRAPTP